MSDPKAFTLLESAIAAHEAYTSFVTAGFTEGQAIQLVSAMLTGQPRPEGGA